MSDDLQVLADESALDARAYLTTLTEVASGSAPDAAIPTTSCAPRLAARNARLVIQTGTWFPAVRNSPDVVTDFRRRHPMPITNRK